MKLICQSTSTEQTSFEHLLSAALPDAEVEIDKGNL